jgi:hypothetical protein
MDLILWLQALEPRAVVRLVFAGISWCGDGPFYFPCALTACLRPRGYPRRPGRMEMDVRCSPSLIPPPFRVRHLTYATSCRTSGLE